ncbi:MAG: DUF368 domain-containing protein [Clostridia bacterium]|nr:DUF368 domain-containing protein [Clostridia bacterium]
MALADSVPGVSGGTVAFILGFYDKFINSLNNLISGNKEERIDAIKFLAKLLSGWVIGMILAVLLLSNVFESHIYAVSSLFLGFIIFAIPVIIKEEKESIKGKYVFIIFTIIGIAIVAAITYFNPVSGEGANVDISSLNLGLCIYVFISAMIAISAMVLPGISGSTLLLIFGLYIPVINAIKELLHLNLSYLPVLVIFGLGLITGILLIIKLIKKALEKFRPQTIYLIIGLMIGSLYAIIMGPTTLDVPKDPMTTSTFSIIFFIIGGAIIFGLEKLKSIIEKK